MEKALFDELLQSLKEAKAISKGTAKASRRFKVEVTDVKAVREGVGLTQDEFAKLIRVSIKTLQNWEQRRREPTGPAAALLKIVATEPQVALRSLHG
jgi:DNA-binding transcriptional regulator YiaG